MVTNMGVISIYESNVNCLSSILDLERKCANEKVKFSAETNKHLLYLTLEKMGVTVAQKAVSKLVSQGEIKWKDEEDFEVEQILDYVQEDGVDLYFIKWKGWSSAHNTWEPKDNLECPDLIEEYHYNLKHLNARPKRKYDELEKASYSVSKRMRIDEIFMKLISCNNGLTPLKLISQTSQEKQKSYRGLVTCQNLKVPRFNNTSKQLLNPRTKAYKERQKIIAKALKDWEKHLNTVGNDPAIITVENNVDLEGPPDNFVYINDYKSGEGVEIPDDPVIGCECTDCFKEKKGCCAAQFGMEFAYHKSRKLRIGVGHPVYECNKRCLCGPTCPNRIVQQGRRHRVCVFRTSNGRGWGVKASQKIKAGSFVMEYVGEVITNEEAETRGKMYDAVGRTYLFDLDFNGDDCPFTVDAAVYGNVSHFVNHSCDPNLAVYGVWINTLDPRLPRIALFSRRDIDKGEELTFDYMAGKSHSLLDESNGEDAADEIDGNATQAETETVDVPNPITKTQPAQLLVDDSSLQDKRNRTSDTPIKDTTNTTISTDTQQVLADSDGHTDTRLNSHTLATSDVDNPDSQIVDVDDASVVIEGDKENVAKPADKEVVFTAMKSSPVKALLDVDLKTSLDAATVKEPLGAPVEYRMVCQCGAANCRKFVF